MYNFFFKAAPKCKDTFAYHWLKCQEICVLIIWLKKFWSNVSFFTSQKRIPGQLILLYIISFSMGVSTLLSYSYEDIRIHGYTFLNYYCCFWELARPVIIFIIYIPINYIKIVFKSCWLIQGVRNSASSLASLFNTFFLLSSFLNPQSCVTCSCGCFIKVMNDFLFPACGSYNPMLYCSDEKKVTWYGLEFQEHDFMSMRVSCTYVLTLHLHKQDNVVAMQTVGFLINDMQKDFNQINKFW